MLKQALDLWKREKNHKGTTLQCRLILFFACVTVFLILAFALLLMLFGINGKGEKAVQDYLSNELSHASGAVSEDFGRLSVLGIRLSETLSRSCDAFFQKNGITAAALWRHPDLLEPLLAGQMQTLLSTMDNNTCSGTYLLLDATVRPGAENAAYSRAGIFIRKTQPVSVQSVGAKNHYLRGPAQIARDNGIELLGQWQMEYDTTGEDFFREVMETARQQEALPLSRLYYWTGRITLHGNSESSFLLCVPLRSAEGNVFGVCGIEVSDRMFKQRYSPQESDYQNVFALVTPCDDASLQTSQGLIAGNYYLTGYRMAEDLEDTGTKNGFARFAGSEASYGGLADALRLYPVGSPYEEEQWSVAVLMPEDLLDAAIQGNSSYLIVIIAVLLVLSLSASVMISRRYLRPVTKALDSIRNRSYEDCGSAPYWEINDLFVFLAEKDNEHEAELRQRDEKYKGAQQEYQKAQTELARLADRKRQEIDEESYLLFRSKLKTLTPKEREVFGLYLEGKSAREITTILEFTENALKYHNKNIYSKLGVSSRRELLLYAALMKQDAERQNKV